MFYFTSANGIEYGAASILNCDLASPQLYIDYYDAFNCECRCYGRLKEENREDLAVRAHGYLLLTPKQEHAITKKVTGANYTPYDPNAELDFHNPWRRSEEHRHLPVRAIVKDLATDPEYFCLAQIESMWKDLKDLHRLGILVRDITVYNYLGGKLIDFSRSWAWPHPGLTYVDARVIQEERRLDPHNLRMAIIEFGMGQRWDWDKVEIPDGMTKCARSRGDVEKYGVDPRGYNWQKWEEKPDEADAAWVQMLIAKE